MSGGGSGIGRRGGKAAVDTQDDEIGGSWEFFRNEGGVYLWGKQERGSDSYTGLALGGAGGAGAGSDMLRAVPHIFPRAGRIKHLGFFPTNVNGGPGGVRLAIYADAGGYPGQLLAESPAIAAWSDPAATPAACYASCRWAANLDVDAMSMLWAAWNYDDQLRVDARGLSTFGAESSPGVLGYFEPTVIQPGDNQVRAPSAQARIYGWRHAQAFGPMPTSFPSSAPKILADGNSTAEPTTWTGKILTLAFAWTNAS